MLSTGKDSDVSSIKSPTLESSSSPTGVHRVEKGATYKDRVLGDLYNEDTGLPYGDFLNNEKNNLYYSSKGNKKFRANVKQDEKRVNFAKTLEYQIVKEKQLAKIEKSKVAYKNLSYWEVFQASVSSGTDNLQGMAYGALAVTASFVKNSLAGVGADELASFFTKGEYFFLREVKREVKESQRNGVYIPNIEDIDWTSEYTIYKVVSLFGSIAPQTARCWCKK